MLQRNPTYDIIWAYGVDDGDDSDVNDLEKHSSRGVQEIDLFAYNVNTPSLPADATSINFTNNNVSCLSVGPSYLKTQIQNSKIRKVLFIVSDIRL